MQPVEFTRSSRRKSSTGNRARFEPGDLGDQARVGSVAEWLAHRTRDLEVTGSIPDHAYLGKQFTLTFPSPPICKMGTQLQAFLEFVIYACNTLHNNGFKMAFKCTGLLGH
ncbi:hypothetical protein ElyMa_002148600 [Elysia marginata]|uniref:HECT domain-containing protein n=1 Tax=Elysia marginata TaxID=1093978 RepID=A0AAV4FKT8_9GAST|nr:hypothetical protein ElyMa_002148600 [Elysia marginata]